VNMLMNISVAQNTINIFLCFAINKKLTSWLRHCVTIRKVAGSIPDGFIAIFHLLNHCGRTVDLRSDQTLT
jgi:hypothetical protein